MVQRGRRAIFEPEAVAWEKPSRDVEDEYRRKVRMFEHCWLIVLRGRMLRGIGPTYVLEVVSHRHLRYASGLLHVLLLGSSIALIRAGLVYDAALALQLLLLAAAAVGVGIARYYVLVTWATVVSLVRYLRFGVPAVWAKPEATRRTACSTQPSRRADWPSRARRSPLRPCRSSATTAGRRSSANEVRVPPRNRSN